YDDPIITITENGTAYDDPHVQDGQIRDSERTSFLHQHLAAVHSAIGEGVTVDGYFVGSLMDNFAWADGFTRRSGIVHVDFDTQIRTIKQSGRWYSRVIERNALVDPF
ncbi:MAG: family 1 glycosylhydrolase, partial [Thermomicrobiales bacterium]